MSNQYFNLKLLILPFIIIISIIILSLTFSNKINILKKEIDLIYFGNFVPVNNLHNIKYKYLEIIKNNKSYSKNKDLILKSWNEYLNGYKTNEEKKKLEIINKQIISAFKTKKRKDYLISIENVDFLINHETNSAYLQRKEFLKKYDNMIEYLYYSQVTAIVLLLMATLYIIYQVYIQTSQLKKLNDKYKVEANTDALTNLYNRKYFNEVFKELMPVSKSNKFNSAFVMIDIDFFKQYNDTYGHAKGDETLIGVAQVLDTLLDKEYEFSFRLGGEEFGIIIFNTNKQYVSYTLNNIQHQIKELKIEHSASKTGFLTLSMGVTIIDKSNYNVNYNEIYELTDKKLYESKQNGRNQYTF